MILQNILCHHYNASRIVVFAANDEFGTKAAMESGDGTYCPMDNLATYLFAYSVTDFSSIITNAINTDATIFLFFCGPENAAQIMEQGYNMGLFHKGTQMFGSKQLLTADLFQYFSEDANIEAIMKGFIGLDYWPDYSVTRTPEGLKFLERFYGHSETITTCSQIKDMTNRTFLYRNGDSSSGPCHGLNYSSYRTSTSSLDSFVALTYDATYLLAYGLQALIEMDKPMNGKNMIDVLMNNVSFDGATGFVQVYIGMPLFAYYAFGDREVGHHYRLRNFHYDKYLLNPNDSFPLVGLWSVEDGVTSCYAISECSNLITNSPNNILTNG